MSSSPDKQSLTSEDTSMGNTNVAAATSNENTPAEDGTWVVHVRRMNGSTLTYNVNPHTETVADLMDRIHREAEIDPMLQRLIFRGQVISHEPHKHLDEFLTESGQTIHMVVRPVSTLRNATANSSTTPTTAPESATGGGGGNNDVPPQIGNIFSAMLPPGLLSGSGQFVIPGGVGGNDGAPGSTQVFMHSFHLDPATGQIVGDDQQQQGGAIPLPFGGIFGRSPMPSGATNTNPQPPSGDSSASAPRRSTPTPTTPGPSDQQASNTSTAEAPEPTTTTSGGGNGVQQMISGLSQLFGNLASAGQQPAAAGGGGSVTATFSTPADGRPSTPPSRPRSQSARLPRGGESSASRSQDGRTRGRVFTRRRFLRTRSSEDLKVVLVGATRSSATTQQRSTGSGEAVMTDSNRIPVNAQQAPVSRAHGAREEDLQRRAEQTPGLPWRTLIDSDARVDHLMSHLAQLPGPRHYRGSDDLPTFLRNYQRLLLSAAQMVGDVSLMLQSDASRGSDVPPNPQRQDDLAYLARMLAELTDTSEMMVSVVNRTWCDMFDPEGQGQVRTREQEDAPQTEGRTSEATEPSAPSLTPYRPTGAAEVDSTSEQGRPSERHEEDRQRGVEHVEEAHRSARLTDESVGQEGASEGSTEQARKRQRRNQ
ncbi:hypothetical protein Pmar_PMAR008908 [Perkinsus marinus ATCC 50983]|uniref:Ubiquitin-like domain-containing protein n=1 Tax=Perkinsus marinus (strain ATCC 50983 / TXsc) TaxID=423536 RepID=C5KAB7_PERM5|nr:hypothetical protein Pmar_PMAR008908 [Perkinsus marinus ATCC 50983]EER18578.1 hypothetical protein Pmar_PMAR008908 [Perkinsus marinus ATCC 50983]|eukprot:XP_002786782.1 hypothetical protein Pmar_PMAR008908 [Perkinsus marinus ATCC 50983]